MTHTSWRIALCNDTSFCDRTVCLMMTHFILWDTIRFVITYFVLWWHHSLYDNTFPFVIKTHLFLGGHISFCDGTVCFVMTHFVLWLVMTHFPFSWYISLCDDTFHFVMAHFTLWWHISHCDETFPFMMTHFALWHISFCESWWLAWSVPAELCKPLTSHPFFVWRYKNPLTRYCWFFRFYASSGQRVPSKLRWAEFERVSRTFPGHLTTDASRRNEECSRTFGRQAGDCGGWLRQRRPRCVVPETLCVLPVASFDSLDRYRVETFCFVQAPPCRGSSHGEEGQFDLRNSLLLPGIAFSVRKISKINRNTQSGEMMVVAVTAMEHAAFGKQDC